MTYSLFRRAVLLGTLVALTAFPAAAEDAAKNPVVAVVSGEKITRSDLEAMKQQMAAQVPQIASVPMEAVFDGLLERAINQKLLTDKAKKAKLQNDPEIKKQLADIEQELVRRTWLTREVDKRVTDDSVKAKYDEFVKNSKPEEEVHARHILVDSEDKAKDLLKKLGEGTSFEQLAKDNSSDGSAKDGGDLGYFKKAAMVPEFAEAAFALKAGEVSKAPVKSQFGWHLIKVEDRRMSKPPAFDEVKDQLKGELAQKAVEDVLKDLRKDVKVETFALDGSPVDAKKTEEKKK